MTIAKQDETKTVITFNHKSPAAAFELKTGTEAWKLAERMAKSDLVPKDYKNKPENTFIAMQMGAELGLKPMQAVQNIAVINGRPCLWGDSMLALAQSHPAYESIEEYIEGDGDNMTAVCKLKRKGQPMCTCSFSVADAKKATLWTKTGPWTQYPKRMLQMRARAFAVRNTFADALRGLQCAEEVRDYPVYRGEATITEKAPALSALDSMLKDIEESKTEDELREAFKDAYAHARYTKDADFFKKASSAKDARKIELGLVDNNDEPKEEKTDETVPVDE